MTNQPSPKGSRTLQKNHVILKQKKIWFYSSCEHPQYKKSSVYLKYRLINAFALRCFFSHTVPLQFWILLPSYPCVFQLFFNTVIFIFLVYFICIYLIYLFSLIMCVNDFFLCVFANWLVSHCPLRESILIELNKSICKEALLLFRRNRVKERKREQRNIICL